MPRALAVEERGQGVDVHVERVNVIKVQAKPKRRGASQGRTAAWKKAVVQLAPGDKIEFFEGR